MFIFWVVLRSNWRRWGRGGSFNEFRFGIGGGTGLGIDSSSSIGGGEGEKGVGEDAFDEDETGGGGRGGGDETGGCGRGGGDWKSIDSAPTGRDEVRVGTAGLSVCGGGGVKSGTDDLGGNSGGRGKASLVMTSISGGSAMKNQKWVMMAVLGSGFPMVGSKSKVVSLPPLPAVLVAGVSFVAGPIGS